jgi:CheY-like chemotaxis protein
MNAQSHAVAADPPDRRRRGGARRPGAADLHRGPARAGLERPASVSVAEFDRADIGAIVLDVRMPGISGLTVLETLVAQGVDQPVIMLTGHGTVEMCRRAFKSGAAEFLEKPVDDEELLEALQNAVRQHVRSRERLARPTRPRASAIGAALGTRARSAGAHRARPHQQGDRARAGAVAAHGGNAPGQPVRQAAGASRWRS